MTRILATLATLSVVLLLANAVIGFSMGDLHVRPRPDSTQTWWTWHFLLGVAAALVVVLVESIIVTYFIGTSRWCKEVTEAYRLDPDAVRASNRLKRRTFPWALAGMLIVVGISALGAAGDPATRIEGTQTWATWHLFSAFVGIPLIAWTYVVAWNNVSANHAIIERLVAEVARIRRERGLDAQDPKQQMARSS
ncbi:MAG TPA: cytochrome b/b6 domain-containing protein [Lacipirellulaceae bacterium]